MPICPTCAEDNPDRARFCLSCGRPLGTGEPSESRRQVTIVFTDLAGSTDLTHRLDGETLHRVMGHYFDAARTAVDRHGGRVEKFIGDAVMSVFGFPMAHEDDALRAVLAAWEMRRSMDTVNEELRRRWDVHLTTRTGIATGTVVASDRSTGEPFVVGTPVNLAARLEQTAGPDEIRLDGTTMRILRNAVRAEAAPPVEMKGFDGPVSAHRLIDVLTSEEGLPRPAPPFVNRSVELRLLHEAFESHLASPRCRSVTLVGSAGLGKSRLVREFLDSHPEVDTVLRSRCLAYGEGSALDPLMDVVGQAARFTNEDDPRVAVERIRELLSDRPEGEVAAAGVAKALGLAPGSTTPEESAWAIRTSVEALARRRPLVLVFDDIQWAAPAFLDVMEHLAEWARESILLVCLARPELLETRPTWGRTPGAVTLQLEPLAAEPSRELARRLLVSATPGVEERVADVADGNPFFLEEIVTMLQEEGAIGTHGGEEDPSRIAIPPTISALLAARIDRLEPASRQVLERAAVIGLAFERGPVEALLPEGHAIDVAATLVDLARHDFVVAHPEVPGDAYRFRHALTREAAYDAIPKSLRIELHRAAADRLGHEPVGEARDERIGYHLEQAHRATTDLGGGAAEARALGERAGTHLAAAGRAAAGRGDVRAAAGLLERAALLLPRDDAQRPAILADLHEALLQAGEIERSQAPVAELLRSLDPDDDSLLAERARLQQTMLRFLLDLGATPMDVLRTDVERSVRRFEEGGDESNLAAALVDLANIHWVEGHATDMLDAAERALAHARASGDRRTSAEAVSLIAFGLKLGPIPFEEGLERLEEIRRAREGDRLVEALILQQEAEMLAGLDRLEDAHRALDRARQTFEDLGQRRWLASSQQAMAELSRREGRMSEAEGLLRSVHRFFLEQGDANNALLVAAPLADHLCDLGRFEEADLLASQMARDASPDDLEIQVIWRLVRARTRIAASDPTGAVPMAEEATAVADSTDFVVLQADARRHLAEALAGAGRVDDAAQALGAALERYGAKGASVLAERARGRLTTLPH